MPSCWRAPISCSSPLVWLVVIILRVHRDVPLVEQCRASARSSYARRPPDLATSILAFVEASSALPLLISYLPTITAHSPGSARGAMRATPRPPRAQILITPSRRFSPRLLVGLVADQVEEDHPRLGMCLTRHSVTASDPRRPVCGSRHWSSRSITRPACASGVGSSLRDRGYFDIRSRPGATCGPISISKGRVPRACDQLVDAGRWRGDRRVAEIPEIGT